MMDKISPVIVVEVSRNTKIGDCDVSATYAPMKTCPVDCVFLNKGCYAQSGYCDIRTKRMNEAAKNYALCSIMEIEARKISELTGTRPLRLHVSGDCPSDNGAMLLARACSTYASKNDMPIWVYTHNWRRIERGCWGDISVLASCETYDDVEEAMDRGYAAVIVSTFYRRKVNSITFMKCRHQYGSETCISCKACLSDKSLRRANKAVFLSPHGHKRVVSSTIFNKQQLDLFKEGQLDD